jgi:hypothetical protein
MKLGERKYDGGMEEAAWRSEGQLEILDTSLLQNMHFPYTCFWFRKSDAVLDWKL